MGKYRRLADVEKERGKPLERIIPPLVNRGGQKLAAEKLGVSQPAISDWLKAHGYESMIIWQKKVTAQEAEDIQRAHDEVNAERLAAGLPTIEQEVESWVS